VFEKMGREATQQLVLEILKLSDRLDCNAGEILHEIDERLAICPYCRRSQDRTHATEGAGLCRDVSS